MSSVLSRGDAAPRQQQLNLVGGDGATTTLLLDEANFPEEGQEVMLSNGQSIFLRREPDGSFTAHQLLEETSDSSGHMEGTQGDSSHDADMSQVVTEDGTDESGSVELLELSRVRTDAEVALENSVSGVFSSEAVVYDQNASADESGTVLQIGPEQNDMVADKGDDTSVLDAGDMVLIQTEDGEEMMYLEQLPDGSMAPVNMVEGSQGETSDDGCVMDNANDGNNIDHRLILPNGDIQCAYCDKAYSSIYSLRRHQFENHGIQGPRRCIFEYPCLETDCDSCFSFKFDLIKHLNEDHSLNLEVLDMTFETTPDFFAWLEEFQDKTCTRFVKLTGAKFSSNGFITANYVCHRSGKPRLKGPFEERQRRHRTFGSCKTGVQCTAHLRVYECEGKVKVNGCSTHYGHEVDPRHMTLLPSHKAMILSYMSTGHPLFKLATFFRGLENDPNSALHYLATAECRNLQCMLGRLESFIPITEKLMLLRSSSCSALIAHKEVGVEYENFDNNDYFAVFQSPAQVEQWKSVPDLTADAVCIDVARHLDFCLITIWVVVKRERYGEQGFNFDEPLFSFPGAYCITNCMEPQNIVQHFYTHIFDQSGKLDCETFFSEDFDEYYIQWINYFITKSVPKRGVALWQNAD